MFKFLNALSFTDLPMTESYGFLKHCSISLPLILPLLPLKLGADLFFDIANVFLGVKLKLVSSKRYISNDFFVVVLFKLLAAIGAVDRFSPLTPKI